MPRTPGIRYYPTRKGFFTCFRKKQILLAKGSDDRPTGPTYLAALRTFTELMESANADKADQGNTVRLICNLYAKNLERNGKLPTLGIFLDT